MIRRILVLARFHLRSLAFSLGGLLYLLLALVFYQIFFAPGQRTPDASYLLFVLGLFGGGYTFLLTLSITAHANEASNSIFMVRLPSRIEYLAAALLAGVSLSTIIQIILATIAAFAGQADQIGSVLLQAPPLWISLNLLAAVLALHASDWASAGWSRSYLFGGLLLLLFAQGNGATISQWLGNLLSRLAGIFFRRQLIIVGESLQEGANWLLGPGATILASVLEALFWPFRTIGFAIAGQGFTPVQALAPAILLVYATILFYLLSDCFAHKDLFYSE